MRVNEAEVSRTYVDGVDAIAAVAAGFTDEQWAAPACGAWSAVETVRHVAAVADWYHDWLDRAIVGDTSRPFAADDIDLMTERSLRALEHLDGSAAVERFTARSTDYLHRLNDHWDLPYSYPFGNVTVGLHAGVAAAEWHLHAWDLSAASTRHQPAEPDVLLIAAGRCVAAAEGGLKGAVLSRLVPVAAKRSPWQQMLKRSGRA